MTDILLTHSYHLFYDPKQVRKMQPYPPLATLYAAALLRQQGFSVALFDTMLAAPEVGFPAALERYHPKIVAVYEDHFNFLSKMCLSRMRQVAYRMFAASRGSGATVIVNGPDSSDHVEEYLDHGARYVLVGEAEWTLLDVAQSILRDREEEPENIPGIIFARKCGEIFRAPSRPALRDLDTLPFPARDLIDLSNYGRAWRSVQGLFSLNLVTSRGCPYRCNWCARPIYGDSFHVRSAESVALEMKELQEVYGAEHLWFADDIFGLRKHWTLEFAEAVNRQRASLPFKIQSRVNLINSETSAALKRSGCTEVWMGIESGSQRILDAMDKGTHVEQIREAREHLRRAGVRACFFLQFGYPGETWEDIEQTIDLVRQTHPDDIGVSVSYPLPGTKFYERVRQQMGNKRNWVDSDDLSVMFHGTYTNEFYRTLRDALHAEVDSWKRTTPSLCPDQRRDIHHDRQHSASAGELWKLVLHMEKTCRNAAPTLAW